MVVISMMYYTMTHQEAIETRTAIARIFPLVGNAHNKWVAQTTFSQKNDVRKNIFEGLSKSLNNYHTALAPLSGSTPFESIIVLPNKTLAENHSNEYFTFCKWGHIINVWVLLEECFRDLAEVSDVDPTEKIKRVVNNILEKYNCQHFADLIHIIRMIRNLQHSNGVCTNVKTEGPYSWNGKTANFAFGQPAESWVLHEDFLISEVQNGLVECFEAIFNHPSVSSTQHIPRKWLLMSQSNQRGVTDGLCETSE